MVVGQFPSALIATARVMAVSLIVCSKELSPKIVFSSIFGVDF